MLYFAYGSNLCASRLVSRAPSANYVGVGWLDGHELRFHKQGRDGSGKADAWSDSTDDVVWGAVAQISTADLSRLDGFEPGYARQQLRILSPTTDWVAWVYRAAHHAITPGLSPRGWYLDHIVDGGRERGLPADYLERLARVDSIPGSGPNAAGC